MRLTQILSEAFDSAVPYEVKKATDDTFTTRAEINGRVISFSAYLLDEGWEIEFSEISSSGRRKYLTTGSGGAFRVFSMVSASMREFYQRYHPNSISFTSDEPTRSKIYLSIMLRSFPEFRLTKTEIASEDGLDKRYVFEKI